MGTVSILVQSNLTSTVHWEVARHLNNQSINRSIKLFEDGVYCSAFIVMMVGHWPVAVFKFILFKIWPKDQRMFCTNEMFHVEFY